MLQYVWQYCTLCRCLWGKRSTPLYRKINCFKLCRLSYMKRNTFRQLRCYKQKYSSWLLAIYIFILIYYTQNRVRYAKLLAFLCRQRWILSMMVWRGFLFLVMERRIRSFLSCGGCILARGGYISLTSGCILARGGYISLSCGCILAPGGCISFTGGFILACDRYISINRGCILACDRYIFINRGCILVCDRCISLPSRFILTCSRYISVPGRRFIPIIATFNTKQKKHRT